MKKVRSSVSADISKDVIWVNSTDYASTVKAVKIHEILMKDFGYTDGSILEEGNIGEGVSLTVCDSFWTVKEMREHYAAAKKQELTEPTTEQHEALAREFLDTLYF
ncbi:hypothetical protein A1OW_13415 [Enterovibrio norvegicus]|uniref:hypothetical protein n=1 Tax=Enterovibrio norvegicus TaxID=188144 RepID=UPI00030E1D39|nr:hypothetical protein [Enterovibrio norvegicus]OEF49193.1 hypothetical protein A1OW_13415 [Enterovibrio norvegicus]